MDKDQTIIGWISDSGVRWGFDAKHRVAEALRETDLNTWQFRLDRLQMGYALPPGGGQLVGDLMYTMHFHAASHKQFLRDRGNYASGKGIQIFVSKSGGMQATGDGPLDNAEWHRWIDWMQARQISWLTWSVADKNETCSMLQPRASSNGGWSEADLQESGRLMREHISENSPGKRKNSNCLSTARSPTTIADDGYKSGAAKFSPALRAACIVHQSDEPISFRAFGRRIVRDPATVRHFEVPR